MVISLEQTDLNGSQFAAIETTPLCILILMIDDRRPGVVRLVDHRGTATEESDRK